MGEQTTKTRAGWIDIAKVLGLVIVLMNHAELSAGGVNYFGGMFYVPVFFVLAGYTFRLRPGESFSAFAKKKAKRLLLPYVGYNAFFFLFFFVKDQLLGGQPLREAGVSLLGILYSRSYLYVGETAGQTVLMRVLNGPTWFLTGLFTALLVFWLLMTWAKGSRKKLLAGMAVCLCAAWGFSFLPVLLPWSLDTLWFHMVLLGAGVLLRETDLIEKLYGCPWKIVLCGLIFFLVSALSGSGNLSVRSYGNHMLCYLAAALLGSVLAMLLAKWIENTFRQAGALIAFAGSHTMAVLCLHLFVFMLISGGYGVLGIDGSRNLWKLWEILGAFVLLVPFYRWRLLPREKGDWQKTVCGLLLLVLVLWSLPLVGKGIDVRDTGSYLTKYRYIFDPSVKVNELHYFLGELAGGIIYALTPVRKVLALNVASSLVYVAAALLTAYVLQKVLPRVLALACALTGSFYGITWIRTLNWNAWTVLFLSAGLALLLAGLQKNSQKWLAAAGFVLAINTYFRMPNMLFLALMAVVFWKTLLDEWKHVGAAEENALAMPDNVASAHRVINHVPDGTVSAEKTGEVKIRALFRPRIWWEALKSCRGFFLGAVAGAAVGLLLALIFLGPDTVLHNLSVLTSVGAGENAENTHSITTGIYLFLLGMRDGALLWLRLGCLLAVVWAVVAGGSFLWKRVRGEASKEAMEKPSLAIYFTAGIACFFGLSEGLREDILSAHIWVAFGVILLGTIGTFLYAKKDTLRSCLCASAVIIEGLLTIGTDTGVNYYRVYMALPLGVLLFLLLSWGRSNACGQSSGCGEFDKHGHGSDRGYIQFNEDRLNDAHDHGQDRVDGQPGGYGQFNGNGHGQPRNLCIQRFACGFCQILAVFTFVFVTTAGVRYAATHVYHDAPNGELTATIDHPMYEDIYTSPARAASLNRLMEELAPYKEQKLLQIGCFNIGCVLTDMKPFYDSSWPDLEYLPMSEFKDQLENALADGQAPVLLLGTVEASGMNWSPSRYAMIRELGESSAYRTLYVDELYTIYVPVEE